MKSFRSTLAALALLIATLPTPISAAPNISEIHDLTGVTNFTAPTTSSTLIRIPRGVDFENLRPSYEGDGRVLGFIIRKTGEYEQEGYRPVMENVTVGQCTKRGCKARDGFSFTVCFCNEKDLPGVWELYVVADGAPVTVSFKIKGMQGHSSVRVSDPVTAEVATLKPRFQESDEHRIYSAGEFTRLKRADFGLVGLWVIGDPHVATAFGECIYYGSGRLPDDVAFTPGCPTADGEAWAHPDPDAGRGGVIFTSAVFDNARGLGGWYATASTVQRYGAVGFWIDFP